MASSNKFIKMRNFALIELGIIIIGIIVSLVLLIFGGKDDSVPVSTEPQVRTRAVINKEAGFNQVNGEKIYFNDPTLGEIFVPVYAEVPKSTLDVSGITTEGNFKYYRDGSFMGIDVSEFQGDIDWYQVKDAGIDFAMIRIGYRSYGEGIIKYDQNFQINIEGAIDAGIQVGAYFFSQAVTMDEAIAEADAVIDAIAPYDITYPVVYDWEPIYEDNARTDFVSVEAVTDNCIAFCERVKSVGYRPMIYQNLRGFMFKLDLPRLKDYEFWLAEYEDAPSFYYDYNLWQYSENGAVPGIEGNVDLNVSFKDYSIPEPTEAQEQTAEQDFSDTDVPE